MIIRQSTSSKVFELFPWCCTLSHKRPYCGQVFTSLYFLCVSPFILRCEYYNSPSHSTGLSHLSDPETPTVVRLIISTWLNLALKVDEPNSLELFDHLSALVGTGIIEGIWIYSIQNVAMKATIDALPSVLRTIGITTASFLKVYPAIFQTAWVAISSHKNSVDYTSTRAYNGNAKHFTRLTRKHQW